MVFLNKFTVFFPHEGKGRAFKDCNKEWLENQEESQKPVVSGWTNLSRLESPRRQRLWHPTPHTLWKTADQQSKYTKQILNLNVLATFTLLLKKYQIKKSLSPCLSLQNKLRDRNSDQIWNHRYELASRSSLVFLITNVVRGGQRMPSQGRQWIGIYGREISKSRALMWGLGRKGEGRGPPSFPSLAAKSSPWPPAARCPAHSE